MEHHRSNGGAALRDYRVPGRRALRAHLAHVFVSPDFDASRRSREFLRFIVEEALAGRSDGLTQAAIATAVFGRRDDFDPLVDPIVRIQAGRLRRSLERYYLLAGRDDLMRIELPKGSYVPLFRPRLDDEDRAPAIGGETPGAQPHDGWPWIEVREFEATGPDPELPAVAVRLGEELSLELGRHAVVRVRRWPNRDGRGPSRDGARFDLAGRVGTNGGGLRVTAHLVDRASGQETWGDEYHTAPHPGRWSGSPEDVARVIAARVGAEDGVIVQQLATERRRRRPAPETAYDALLRSYDFFLTRDPKSLVPAMEALRRVVHSEPECSLAWARLARLCLANLIFEVTSRATPIDEAIEYAERGVRVDPSSRAARCMLATALLFKGELAAGRAAAEQALACSPGSLVYLDTIGYLLTMLGDWDRGRDVSRTALERNPHCLPHVRFGLWADHLRRGEFGEAHQAALEYRDPTFLRAAMRASCLGLLGRTEDGRSEVGEILSRKPDFAERGRILLGYHIKFPEVMDRVVEGLKRSGLELAG
jgi:tetratricopeptide (TPR) repeat protein